MMFQAAWAATSGQTRLVTANADPKTNPAKAMEIVAAQ